VRIVFLLYREEHCVIEGKLLKSLYISPSISEASLLLLEVLTKSIIKTLG